MSEERKRRLPKEVNDFIDRCAKEIGKMEKTNFNINLWNECLDLEMESPIEQLLYCAIRTIAKLNIIDSWDEIAGKDKNYWQGLDIIPQAKIGNYRADFMVLYGKHVDAHTGMEKDGTKPLEVIVECDSQAFHERTERERRYEKIRKIPLR